MTKLYRWRTDQWFPVDNDQSRLGERGKCVYKKVCVQGSSFVVMEPLCIMSGASYTNSYME